MPTLLLRRTEVILSDTPKKIQSPFGLGVHATAHISYDLWYRCVKRLCKMCTLAKVGIMDQAQAAIRTYFKKLGLEPEIADIYLALHSHGPQTISALARNAKVERTRIYRLIGQLTESNLVEVEPHATRGMIKAAPVANVRILINERQAELKNLQDELELVEQALARNSLSNPVARVQFYAGPAGIRQMLEHELETTSETVGYWLPELLAVLDKKASQEWTAELKRRKLTRRLLINTTVAEKLPGATCRQIDLKVLQIRQVTMVHGEVVAHYFLGGGELYGMETYNQNMADSQRQIFEALWAQVSDRPGTTAPDNMAK